MKETKNHAFAGTVIIIALITSVYFYQQALVAPDNFPTGTTFTINENESLKSISNRLEALGYIHSPLLFRLGISYLGKERSIQLGGYIFEKPLTLLGMVETFVRGKPSVPLLSATIPEGSTSFEVASLVAKVLPSLSIDTFGEIISKYQADGKLFPSTYFLLPSYTEEDIVKLMLLTFVKKTQPIIAEAKILPPLVSENDVLVLASILEGEAKTEEDMKIIAGILLTRLTIGMPLQVDVAKETYTMKGLPGMPINNPGLIAINAVLHPITTQYLYYITGNDGKMYYAKTFDEHKRNIQKYLR